MSVQIVMDGSGDTRHEFDASDPQLLPTPKNASRP